MILNRLRGKRLQTRSGSRWTQNTLESVFGLHAPACPACHILNPHRVDEPAPARCHGCEAPLLPACPEHGEASCGQTCSARPCAACGGAGKVAPFIDPKAWREGRICHQCGREHGCCAGCDKPLDPVRRGVPVQYLGALWHPTCIENHKEHSLTAAEIL